MKKFLSEYKALRATKSESGNLKKSRERLTVTTHSHSSDTIQEQHQESETGVQVGTIRTEEYKRDLAEFQARRSAGKENPELPDTPVKKKCGRHSLPVSCTDCASGPDLTFNLEKKSAAKYKKKIHKRTRSAAADDRISETLPNIQFLFQNQVFMPGTIPVHPAYSEARKKRHHRRAHNPPDFSAQKHIDFNEEQNSNGTPLFYKNNALSIDENAFLETDKNVEEVDGAVKFTLNLAEDSEEVRVDKDPFKGGNSDDKLWEAMRELRNLDQWADEQLQGQNTSKSDDSKSDSSAYGLPVACASNIEVDSNRNRVWLPGTWGVIPVQVKRLKGVPVQYVRNKLNTEINILRKYRHPNILLLMGFYSDVHDNIHLICEQCIDTLYGILHVQGRILSAQTAVHYALDIANALVFLRMQGFIHTALNSHSVMVNSHDAAKLSDLASCVKITKKKPTSPKHYEIYSPEPQYVNMEETRLSSGETEPLISQRSSEAYLDTNSVTKEYKAYKESEQYRWHAPELFDPDEEGFVHPCSKSDVYSLSLILWESCNAAVPWKTLTYEKLKELYMLWKTGVRLPHDGTYPGGLLAILQAGLALTRVDRIDLATMHSTLATVKSKLDDLEYIIIPARVSKKQSAFSSIGWDTNSPTDDSECLSPIVQNVQLKAMVHNEKDSDTSAKESKSDTSAIYETLRKDEGKVDLRDSEGCYNSDNEASEERPMLKYEHLPEREIASACSTPIAKMRARIKDIGTPGVLHRSDSTEYCSILSPDNRYFAINDESVTGPSADKAAKLSCSFTPQSYKPLHIKVPEFNLESVKSILKDHSSGERSSYNFDIKNYSLPSTPIARSNKLRKNAWLSGDISATRILDKLKDLRTPKKDEIKVQSAPETPAVSICSPTKNKSLENNSVKLPDMVDEESPRSDNSNRDSFTGLKKVDPPADFSPETDSIRERTCSWTYKSSERPPKYQVEEDVLANVNVKPLVAIHEKWIYEANRKIGRSMSLPEDNRNPIRAVKPASHCVDTLQKSLPQLNTKRVAVGQFRPLPTSPANSAKSGHWEQFCQARETVARNVNFAARDPERFHTWRQREKETSVPEEPKTDQATDSRSIEEFVRDLIRREFQHLMHEISDDTSSVAPKTEEIINKGVANIVENLKNGEPEKKDVVKSFSRVKINGNNKPLLQITFSHSGENCLQVLDNCVNVTICDNCASGREKMNVSFEDTLTLDDKVPSLRRCQTYNAIQEARSTEDLYIDDDLSTQMQENFGGRVKLIPLHGSLHEILCERADDCCLVKVKQENGCDTVYFRCDNSDTESRDAIDGQPHDKLPQDTVVYKRSISLIEERIQRIFPSKERIQTEEANSQDVPVPKRKPVIFNRVRPKSEIQVSSSYKDTRPLSVSSPALNVKDDSHEEVELNIENVPSYIDSSSDECLRCSQIEDDFEYLEKSIENELAHYEKKDRNDKSRLSEGLAKISEENLSFEENEQ